MIKAIQWFKASDGTAATAMDVDLVSEWLVMPIGGAISWQVGWDAGATGIFFPQGSNNAGPINDISCRTSDYPDEVAAGAQPSGTAGDLTIGRYMWNGAVRLKYDATSGTAAVPVGDVIR